MRSVKKTRVKLFRLSFSTPVEKVEFFYWIRQSEFSVEKALFRLRKKSRFGPSVAKGRFRLTNPTA